MSCLHFCCTKCLLKYGQSNITYTNIYITLKVLTGKQKKPAHVLMHSKCSEGTTLD